jgi:N-methylhydantoinase B/oxoprolinase/acetone carboxylase alpha subunit
MARTAQQQLATYREARDAISDAIAAGEDYVRYRIGDREKQVEATTDQLERIEKLIDHYEDKVRQQEGNSVTVADFRGSP